MKNLSLLLFQDSELLPLLIVSAAAVVLIELLFRFLPERKRKKQPEEKTSSLPFVHPSRTVRPWTRKDFHAVILITVLYAIVSLWQLGSNTFPTTTWQPDKNSANQSFILELTGYTSFDQINILYEEGDNNSNLSTYQLGVEGMTIEGSNDLSTWVSIGTLENNGIYEYQLLTGSWDYKYIRVTAASANQTLTEIAFKKMGEDELLPVSVYEDAYADSEYPAELVIDEQDKVAIHPTYYDEGYFDEVYHPRNAKEISDGQYMYATVHPLFGTNIMALFIHLFGFTPLVWRLPGALFGIMIVPLFYGIVRRLFVSTKLAAFGTILCAADFMHLTTSRIGTLEPFSVFFILLMFYWMIRFYQTNFFDTKLTDELTLLLWCGIAMGVGIATKWTACYSAVGLAILLFTNLIERTREYRRAKAFLTEGNGTAEQNAEASHITSIYQSHILAILGWCFVFFIIIPIIIYFLSYLPDKVWRDGWSLTNVLSQNEYMYHYHTTLQATHPYQSTWYQWLLDIRPIWYYSGVVDTGVSHSISCFSNPLLTWAGLPAVFYTLYVCIRKHDRTAWFILIGYITALGPWILLVKRCVFAYHFYPTSFFTMLAIVFAMRDLLRKNSDRGNKIMLIFTIAYVVLFVVFLPATAGFGTTRAYIKMLEWFPTWYFG
jgi:predicted membrane-bound dolichyl-phosphate-mannose-protein mannosyltransferase